jgi:hypothetical protein
MRDGSSWQCSGSGSIGQRHGSADPDPHQNVMDPEHWFVAYTEKDKIPKFLNKYSPEKEYRGLSPNFHIHAPVSNLYISTIVLPSLLEEIARKLPRSS